MSEAAAVDAAAAVAAAAADVVFGTVSAVAALKRVTSASSAGAASQSVSQSRASPKQLRGELMGMRRSEIENIKIEAGPPPPSGLAK